MLHWKVGCSRLRVAFFATIAVLAPVAAAGQTTGAAEEVWLGAPFSTTMHPKCASDAKPQQCPFPFKHWINYGGHWSVDLPKMAYSDVRLYLAPQHSRDSVTAEVEKVTQSCNQNREGGQTVRVAVFVNGKQTGTVAYTHVNTTLKMGNKINRWGGKVGTIFTTTKPHELCWTGAHLHLEVSSKVDYSCYNKGIVPLAKFNETNFIGFVSGSRASGQRKACS